MADVFLNVLTRRSLEDRRDGARILDLLSDHLPLCVPELAGNWEPLHSIEASNRAALLTKWSDPFLWRHRIPRCDGNIFMRGPDSDMHAGIYLSSNAGIDAIPGFASFLQAVAVEFQADLGFVHMLTPEDLERGRLSGTVSCLDPARQRFYLSLTTHDLRRGLPDVYWATVFGQPYVQQFGLARLLGAPANVVKKLSVDLVYVQLTDAAEDLHAEPQKVEKARDMLKAYLGTRWFIDGTNDAAEGGAKFDWRQT